jgi:hypothetical protein
MRKAYDLTLAALRMSGNPKAAEVIKAIRKFKSVTSVSNDLSEAKASVDELIEIRESINERPHVARALLMHAVVTYCRATHTKAIERFNVGITRAYSQKQKKMHNGIVQLRDTVLAHFGPGDGWHDERVIFLEQAKGNAITSAHRRRTHDSLVVETLEHLLNVAIPFAKERQRERADELHAILESQPELFKLVQSMRFDPGAFFQNAPGSVERFWEPGSFSMEHTETTIIS